MATDDKSCKKNAGRLILYTCFLSVVNNSLHYCFKQSECSGEKVEGFQGLTVTNDECCNANGGAWGRSGGPCKICPTQQGILSCPQQWKDTVKNCNNEMILLLLNDICKNEEYTKCDAVKHKTKSMVYLPVF